MFSHRMRRYDGCRVFRSLGHLGRSRAILPTQVAGLVSWWKADGVLWQDSARTTAATATNDPVGALDDAFASNHLLQGGIASTRPLLKLGIQAGLPALLFDGSNDWLTKTFTLNQPATYFIVYASVTVGASGVNDYIFDGGNATCRHLRNNTPQSILNAGSSIFAGADNLTTFRCFSGIASGTSSLARLNSHVGTGTSAGTNNPGGFTLGGQNGSGSRPTNIYFGEAFVYNVALNLQTMIGLETYLMNRWNLWGLAYDGLTQ